MIDLTLKDCFTSQDKIYPQIALTSLKKLMVDEAKLSFKDTVAFNRLFSNLSSEYTEHGISQSEMPNGEKYVVNLK